mmetsp:Transcript_43338/g.110886  ORF Transcript_43338/g.110886 Transcript_43338/m.110886 type:complete len:155 (+) Transcript_43338:291-755(+)
MVVTSSTSAFCCACHMPWYTAPRRSSSSWLPSSITRPSRITTILSQCRMVDRRCATKTEVRPTASSDNEARIPDSVFVSRADVLSSQMSNRGARRKARAIATRCFSPPLSFRPRSPTSVSYPSGMFAIVESSLAIEAASRTSASVAPGRPYSML